MFVIQKVVDLIIHGANELVFVNEPLDSELMKNRVWHFPV